MHLNNKVKNLAIVLLLSLLPMFGFTEENNAPISSIHFKETGFYSIFDTMVKKHFPAFNNPEFIPSENDLTLETITLLAFNLGSLWEVMAPKLKIEKDEVNRIITDSENNPTLSAKHPKVTNLSSNDLFPLNEEGHLIDQILMFLASASEKNSTSEILTLLKSYYPDLHKLALYYQKNTQPKIGEELVPQNDIPSEYTSYIYFVWLKHFSRKQTSWGHVIPNTVHLPHQQTIYNWARRNPDKYVVLWYDSKELNQEELDQYEIFRLSMKETLSNFDVLDIQKIYWTDLKLSIPGRDMKNKSVSELLDNMKFTHVGDKVEFLRMRLMHEGSRALKTARANSGRDFHEMSSPLPQRGVYFDLDYIPRYFDASIIKGNVCIDNVTHSLSKPKVGTKVKLGRDFPNSLLAVNHDHVDLLKPDLRIEINSFHYLNAGKKALVHYWEWKETLSHSIFQVCGINGFEMGGSANIRKGDAIGWNMEYAHSWAEKYHPELDNQFNADLLKW